MFDHSFASSGLEIDEALIFERSIKGALAIDFLQEEKSSFMSIDDEILKYLKTHEEKLLLPELSEPDLVRHYTRLSRKNFAIDLGSYPLGSCTMKYNPKLHEWAARLPGLCEVHPYAPIKEQQWPLRICFELQSALAKLAGFHKVSLAPSAGAQGEFAGLLMIDKALKMRKEKRTKILVPKSAHGTNPATAAMFSYGVLPLDLNEKGRIVFNEVEKLMNDDCVGIMITNPNTLGIFEDEQEKISRLIHDRGGYVYGDGANLNALMGKVRPHDLGVDVMHYNLHKTMTTPHGGGGPGCGAIGASSELSKYLPVPIVNKNDEGYFLEENNPDSIGRIRSFIGNFSMIVRAFVYIKTLGDLGLREASEIAVFNANYVREKLKPYYHLPYESECLHEVVFSDLYQQKYGVCAMDIAKRLIDYGIHPPTVNFPLVVKGALMIEPTETESIYELDRMIEAFIKVAIEAKEHPEMLKSAPHKTSLSRLDETKAARFPVLSYQESLRVEALLR